nr:nitrate/nitrite response regulator protein NarL-like [Nerophis lumbriciformis]
MTISIMIADDQEMVRTGLRQMIGADPQLNVVGTADDGRQALDMARALKPAVCLLDIRMPILTGLEVTRELASDPDPPAIVIITTYDLEEYLFESLEAGASGFVLKGASAAVLNQAIHSAAAGDALISPGLTHVLIKTYLKQMPRSSPSLTMFTPREQDVLRSVCRGATNDEIARALELSVSTVKGHLTSLMHKTTTSSRVKLVIWAYRNTTITP